MFKKVVIWTACVVLAGGIAFVGLRGCTAMPWNKNTGTSGSATISITRDYGRRVIKEGDVTPDKGESIMEALQSVARVETEYSGGFVSSIEGLATTSGSTRKDWFYYLNGVMSGVGADQVVLKPGDNVWWDYHEWHGKDFAAAAVGAYPAPFTRGYDTDKQNSTIVYGDGMEAAAREVGAFLQKNGARVKYEGDTGNGTNNGTGSDPFLVFMTCEQAQRTPWVAGLLTGDTGAFVAVDKGSIVALDANGRPSPTQAPITCAVVSTATGMGDASPMWFVLCDKPENAGLAISLLTSGRASLKNKIGIVVDSGGKLNQVPR